MPCRSGRLVPERRPSVRVRRPRGHRRGILDHPGGISARILVEPPGTPFISIHAGGPALGRFLADQDFSGGNTFTASSPVSTAGVADAAPAGIYASERAGEHGTGFSYAIPGLEPGRAYTVRLHFAEIYYTAKAQREFGIAINGTTLQTGFDIVAAALAPRVAVVRDFPATDSAEGRIVIALLPQLDVPKLSGLEILNVATPPPTR
jgi:hypothetical protein